jgi:phenylalanyl-tRNA synthetase beta chain
MPTITLNKKVFEQLVGKELPLEELKDRISMLGTDLESIKDNEIEVEIFPNRPDMLSEQGFARAFSSFINVKTGLREYQIKKSGQKVIIDSSVKDIRPFTACAIIRNLNLDEEKIREIIQIQEKLHITYGRNRKKCAIGVYPLEKITFPIYYKADKPINISFQPLEANRKMTGAEILTEHKTGKEFAHLLEGLDKYPYFIDAAGEILSMPPIINSYNVGRVTKESKDLFIECSGFDFNTLSICLNIIVTSLSEMGGEIHSLELEYQEDKKSTIAPNNNNNNNKTKTNKSINKTTPNLTPTEMELDLEYINNRLGLELTKKEAITLLAKMGFGFENEKVLIPAYRADILHQVDLVEDIAIAYGYENFQEEIPNVTTIGEENKFSTLARKIRELLVGLQLLEVKNYHLTTKENLNLKMNLEQQVIPLKNALGEHNHLRNSLLPCLLKNLQDNQHHEYPQNIFEIGRIFQLNPKTETGVEEKEKLTLALCHDKVDFTQIKQTFDALTLSFGINCIIKETSHPSYIIGRVGELIIEEKRIGFIGEIHPSVLENWQLTVPVVVLEIDLESLFEKI